MVHAHNTRAGGNGKQATSKMKVLLVLFALFYLIEHGADAFSIGCSIHRATCRNSRCSVIEQQGQSAKKKKPIHVRRSATCMLARPKVTDDEYAERKEQLRQLLCLDQKGINKLVGTNLRVLNLDVDGNIAPKSEMLQRKLSIDQKRAGRILSCPGANRLIAQNQEITEAKIDYLQYEMGLSDQDVAKVLVAYPQLLARSIKDHYEPLFNALPTSLGFTRKEIAKLAIKNPQFPFRTSKQIIESAAYFLPHVFGLDEQDKEGLKKYIRKRPRLLHTPESRLRESYEWILNLLGESKSVAARVCRNRPQFLTMNSEHLQKKVDWYRDRLSLTDEEIREVVAHYPNILLQSIEDGKMDKKLRHIQEMFQINNKELKELFLKRPEFVALSAEKNIEPKLELYGSLIGKERARKLVLQTPYLLLKSLGDRIKPRLEEVGKAYEYVEWTETLLRRLVHREPKIWCDYMLDDAPRGRGEKLDDSGRYKRRKILRK